MLLPKLLPATMTSADLANNSRNIESGPEVYDPQLWVGRFRSKALGQDYIRDRGGWLVGPLDWDSLEEGSSVSRRFPLEQAGKVRPIDDLSQSQVNATVTCFEKATVDGPDVICAFAVFLMRSLLAAGKPTKLLGRSLDLASAYRQLAISDSSQRHAFCRYTPRRVGELSFSDKWPCHLVLGLQSMPLFVVPGFCSGWRPSVCGCQFHVILMIWFHVLTQTWRRIRKPPCV